jgi:hypothetical protein
MIINLLRRLIIAFVVIVGSSGKSRHFVSSFSTTPIVTLPRQGTNYHQLSHLLHRFKMSPSPIPNHQLTTMNNPPIWAMRMSTTADNSEVAPRPPTLRRRVSSFYWEADEDPPTLSESSTTTEQALMHRAQELMQHAQEGVPLTTTASEHDSLIDDADTGELDRVIDSWHNLYPLESSVPVPWDDVRALLQEVAHLSHKDWARTERNAERLGDLLWPSNQKDTATTTTPSGVGEHRRMEGPSTRQFLERILRDGNWDGAAQYAVEKGRMVHSESSSSSTTTQDIRPWAVLVTGVNGIRKTTSLYQPWFAQLLQEALVPPAGTDSTAAPPDLDMLPTGSNSFFRQLDHMIATLCNEEFAQLYTWTAQLWKESPLGLDRPPPPDIVQKYSYLKAAIFTRYRTLSELLGVLLLKEAQKYGLNALLETSGRDVAMFHYMDHFFPSHAYRKLVLHFTIDHLSHAQNSVDQRMIYEMQKGVDAIRRDCAFTLVDVNAGGPYGSEVLAQVQADSETIWDTQVVTGNVGSDWYRACIHIQASDSSSDKPWTAQAVRSDGSYGTSFAFQR